MSINLKSWLTGDSPLKPGSKRKIENVSDFDESVSKRKFTEEFNQNSFDWYVKDEAGKWHCELCRSAKLDNAYANGHDKPSKTTNHSRHSSSKDHLTSVQRSKLKEQKPLQTLIVNKLTKDDETVMMNLKCAYYLAKRELPKAEMSHQAEFFNFVTGKSEMKTSDDGVKTSDPAYTSNKSVSEFHEVISDIILDDKINQIYQSGVFSLVLDESTDSANMKRVIMYAQCVTDTGLDYCLLSNKQLKEGSGNSENIVAMVVDELKSKGLDIRKMVGISTDGASVMTGRKNGVVVKLREYSPCLVGVHCAAHRVALAVSQAAKSVPNMNSYSRTVSRVFRYVSNSALRANRLREIQSLLQLPELKFAEVHSVRWLSLEKAVTAVYRSYPAMCMFLEGEAAFDTCAKGLFEEVSQYKFIALTHLLMDILPHVGRLSETFQTQVLDFSMILPEVSATVASLEDVLECEGVFVSKLSGFVKEKEGKMVYSRSVSESLSKSVKESIAENTEFEGFDSDDDDGNDDENVCHEPTLKYYTQQKNVLENVSDCYISKNCKNLTERFQDSEILKNFEVLVPSNISGAKKVGQFGAKELNCLIDHYGTEFCLNKDDCLSEYQYYKQIVIGSYKEYSLLELVETVQEKHSSKLPNMLLLLKLAVVIPLTSVQCERGFSTQNRIKCNFRTRLGNKSLDCLMRISEDGPEIGKFDFNAALKKWKLLKTRKIYYK